MKFQTTCIHGDGPNDATGAVSPAIYCTSTFSHPHVGESTGFNYTRESNPTHARLEKVMSIQATLKPWKEPLHLKQRPSIWKHRQIPPWKSPTCAPWQNLPTKRVFWSSLTIRSSPHISNALWNLAAILSCTAGRSTWPVTTISSQAL